MLLSNSNHYTKAVHTYSKPFDSASSSGLSVERRLLAFLVFAAFAPYFLFLLIVSAWGEGGFRCASAASASTAASFSDIVMEGSCRLIFLRMRDLVKFSSSYRSSSASRATLSNSIALSELPKPESALCLEVEFGLATLGTRRGDRLRPFISRGCNGRVGLPRLRAVSRKRCATFRRTSGG